MSVSKTVEEFKKKHSKKLDEIQSRICDVVGHALQEASYEISSFEKTKDGSISNFVEYDLFVFIAATMCMNTFASNYNTNVPSSVIASEIISEFAQKIAMIVPQFPEMKERLLCVECEKQIESE